MDELDEARTDLCQLEETERTLLKQLVKIRAAIKAQKDKIDELIKKQPPAINRLPVELLSRIIFQSLPTLDDYGEFSELANRRTNLSTVSRLWRNVILTTPEIWGDIVWRNRLPVAFLKTELIRSGNIPLNVFILNRPRLYDRFDPQWLDVLVSSTNRWRRLHIQQMTPEILHAFEDLKFPSLEDVLIDYMDRVSTYPQFLLPDEAPALRNLQLNRFLPTPKFTAAPSLTTLELEFRYRGDQHQIVNPTFIPTHSITMLSLTGCIDGWALSPDSIHLPHLEKFKLEVSNPKPVMRAIVTPKLMYFDYRIDRYGLRGDVSFGTGSKFSHVQRVTLHLRHATEGRDALCQEFHGVQHVDLDVDTICGLFAPEAQLGDSEWAPADHWTNLESLTIHGLCYYYPGFDLLVRWLTKRLELGWPRLSVGLSGHDTGTGMDFHNIYNKLRTCSNLRVVDVEMNSSVRCSTSDGLLRLGLFGVEPLVSLVDDMFLD